MVQDWTTVTLQALQNLWQGFLNFIPKLIGAIVVFVIGWFVAVWIGKLVAEILRKLRVDKIFEKTKWEEAFEKAEFKMKMSDFIGGIVKWVLVIVFLLAAVEILGLTQFAAFLRTIVAWLPNLVVAAAIFVVAVIIADIAEKLVKAIVGKMNVRYVSLVGSIVKWAIWIFAILAILAQLGVAPEIIQILIGGFVALVVISCSIAFGLGGKDLAREFLEGLRNKFRE
jgi:small-conductance mechanosensitive channel